MVCKVSAARNVFRFVVDVEFIKIAGEKVEARIWERGAGETRACGSGASAIAAVLNKSGLVKGEVLVSMPGGEIKVFLRDEKVFIRGATARVFEGNFDPEKL